MLTPQLTFVALLIVQALHLLHHRLAKRHISFGEVASAFVLCIPLMTMHLALASVQVVGSVWIRRLSPDWAGAGSAFARLG